MKNKTDVLHVYFYNFLFVFVRFLTRFSFLSLLMFLKTVTHHDDEKVMASLSDRNRKRTKH